MDIVDIANDRADEQLQARIDAARRSVPHEDGPEVCNECDEPIPPQRRRLGYALCVPCAAGRERVRALHARPAP